MITYRLQVMYVVDWAANLTLESIAVTIDSVDANGGGADVKIRALWCALMGLFLAVVAPSIALSQELFGGPTQLPSFSVQPTVYIGYLSPSKATTFSLGNSASNTFNIRSLEQTLNVQGVWTEFTLPVKGSGPLGLLLDFGYLFPINKQSEETYLTNVPEARTWNTSSQLWNCQVAVTYHALPSVTAIAGFRYESFMTNYRDPENEVGNLSFRQVDIAEFNFNGYIPFLGVMVEKIMGGGSSLKASLIGIPGLFGSFVYKERVNVSGLPYPNRWNGIQASNEFSSGYFFEAWGDWSVPVSWWAKAGAFIKYSGVYGKTTTAVNTATSVPTTPTSEHYERKNDANGANVTFERSSWIVGGTISANF